jgi:hypothetical protein
MNTRFLTLISMLLVSSMVAAQEAPSTAAVEVTTEVPMRTYMLELTQLRWNSPGEPLPDQKSLNESLAQLRAAGKLTDAESIRLSVLEGHKCSVQFGRQVMVTTATSSAPGARGTVRSLQSLEVGTTVRARVESRQGKLQVELSYQASQFGEAKQDDVPPDTTQISADSTLLFVPGETIVVAAHSADTSVVLLARITE